jgi:hypothetical protein
VLRSRTPAQDEQGPDFELQHYQKKTSKQIKMSFFKNRKQEGKSQVLSGGWHQWEWGGYKERV